MQQDLLSDALSKIQNAEIVGKTFCIVPKSELIMSTLNVLQKSGYLGKFSTISGKIKVELLGKINKARSIKPRFSVSKDEFEKFETRYLPSRDIGMIIVSTSQGIISHKEAKNKKIGGKLLAFVY